MITSITDYHRPNQREVELKKCDACGNTFNAKDVRRSKVTGEDYCFRGNFNCWNEAKETHESQSLEWHGVVTSFE